MQQYPDMRELSRLAATKYEDVTSLEQINRQPRGKFEKGYPGAGTPEWWALRIRLEALMAAQQRKGRAAAKWIAPETPEYIARSKAAKWTALGNEEAQAHYQRGGGG